MLLDIDVNDEVILVLDGLHHVVDAFRAKGITKREVPNSATAYTYRSLLTPPGSCAVCGRKPDAMDEPCSSSGGFHAFAGVAHIPEIPDQHKLEHRALAMTELVFQEFTFYVEPDNLFPISEDVASEGFAV